VDVRVLVTGASGFVGRHTQRYLLDQGFEVHGVGRSVPPSWALPGVVPHECDLLDAAATAALVNAIRPTHLLHLAWYAVPGKFWTSAENLLWIDASKALVEAVIGAGGSRAVIAGTCAEYAWTGEVCAERVTSLQPATLYGRCKLELHEWLESPAIHRGLSTAWARLFFMYGAHERAGRLVSSVSESLLTNREVACSAGKQWRDFMLVDDVARALVALLCSAVEGPVNIASGEARPVGDVIRMIGAATGRPDLIRWGAKPEAPGEPDRIEACTHRLNNEVHFSPAFTLESGIRQTVDWWRAELERGH
jgi:nucleoside-diphosphate-sugar epimerase